MKKSQRLFGSLKNFFLMSSFIGLSYLIIAVVYEGLNNTTYWDAISWFIEGFLGGSILGLFAALDYYFSH